MTVSGHSTSDRTPSRITVWTLVALCLIPLIVGTLLAWHSLSDIDIWLHNRVGRELLSGDGSPANSDFTFSAPDHPWTNHEFLFQLLIAPLGPGGPPPETESIQAVDVGGWNLLRTCLTALIVLLLAFGDGRWRHLRNPSRLDLRAAWWSLPLLGGLLLLWPRLILRPELVSYLFFILAVRLIENALFVSSFPGSTVQQTGQTSKPWARFLDPRHPSGSVFWVTLIWAWFHGFADLVPALWLLGGILTIIQGRISAFRTTATPATAKSPDGISFRAWLLVLGLSLAGLALTPNGIDGLLYPLRALGQFSKETVDMKRVISELVPLLQTQNSLHWTLWAFRLSLIWSALWILLTWGRISLLRIVLLILTAIGALLGQRNLGFYALAFCLLHSGVVPAAIGARYPHRLWDTIQERLPAIPSAVPLILGILLTVSAGTWWGWLIVSDRFYLHEGVGRRFGSEMTPAQYPLAAAANIGRADGARVFSNLGGAALLLDRTSARLFIDGRTEAFPPARWAQYMRIRRGGEEALAELGRLNVQQILIGGGGSAFQKLAGDLLADSRWRLELAEEAGLLFARAGAGHQAETDTMALRRETDRLETNLASEKSSIPGSRFADRCLAVSRLWKMAGKAEKQEATLRTGLELRPDHPTLLHNLGNLLLNQKKYAQARGYFNSALRGNPRLAGSALNLGACLMSERRPREAASAFARSTRINPDLFEAWVNLGMALEQSGRASESVRALEKALELRPGDQRLRRYLSSRRR